jgi:Large polyvalent protein-associated domain 7
MATTPDDTDLRTRLRGEPSVTPEDTRSELLEEVSTAQVRDRVRSDASLSPEDTRSELLAQEQAVNKGLDEQLEEEKRRRIAREQEQAGQGLNNLELFQKVGKELERDDFIMPRRIQQAYTELDGKFFEKDTKRVVFADKGEKLATSTTNKEAIADMVAYAKAKQWESIKLTGSQEFRREAWLQAESQGIKTQGYTPKEKDLTTLETLRQERATNTIQPVQERKVERDKTTERDNVTAPRHDINKNQPAMAVATKTNSREHFEAIQKLPGLEGKSFEHLNKIAEMRALVAERDKLRPPAELSESLARFDKLANDPQFQKRVEQETVASVEDKTTERTQKRDTHEQSR